MVYKYNIENYKVNGSDAHSLPQFSSHVFCKDVQRTVNKYITDRKSTLPMHIAYQTFSGLLFRNDVHRMVYKYNTFPMPIAYHSFSSLPFLQGRTPHGL